MKLVNLKTALALCAIAGLSAGLMTDAQAQKGGKKSKMDTPTISCDGASEVSINIKVKAGATGAPAGFSLQWITYEQFANGPDGEFGTADDNTWPASDAEYLCKASFSGNANMSRYNLGPNEEVTVNIGEMLFDNGASTNCIGMLECGTTYVFRAFAHANNTLARSEFTQDLFCSTLSCGDTPQEFPECTYTQGFWKTHGSAGPASGRDEFGNYISEWPVDTLSLGGRSYTEAELQSIFDTPAAGNGLLALAHQLIAAKLNVAGGGSYDMDEINQVIADADALIGSLVVPPVGDGYLKPNLTSYLTGRLAGFNEGAWGPGHCE